MIHRARTLGVTSDTLQFAALASLAGSVLTWRSAKASGDPGHAERQSLFIGLLGLALLAFAESIGRAENAEYR